MPVRACNAFTSVLGVVLAAGADEVPREESECDERDHHRRDRDDRQSGVAGRRVVERVRERADEGSLALDMREV